MSKLRALAAEVRDLRAERDNPFNQVSRDQERQLNVKIVQAIRRFHELLNPNRR
jgi:hypothetical protein